MKKILGLFSVFFLSFAHSADTTLIGDGVGYYADGDMVGISDPYDTKSDACRAAQTALNALPGQEFCDIVGGACKFHSDCSSVASSSWRTPSGWNWVNSSCDNGVDPLDGRCANICDDGQPDYVSRELGFTVSATCDRLDLVVCPDSAGTIVNDPYNCPVENLPVCTDAQTCLEYAAAQAGCGPNDPYVFDYTDPEIYVFSCNPVPPDPVDNGELVGQTTTGCTDYDGCYSDALAEYDDCSNDRDQFYFTYTGTGYFSTCIQCEGPTASDYPECSSCQYGSDSSNNCYSSACPYGNCADPTDETATTGVGAYVPDDNGDVVAAIRDGQVQSAQNSGELSSQLQDIACLVGSNNAQCPQSESYTVDHDASASAMYSQFQSTAWGGSLTSIAGSASGVSSQCTLDFDVFVPIAEKTMTVSICTYLEPIADILRAFAIALWGLMGIRHVFSA